MTIPILLAVLLGAAEGPGTVKLNTNGAKYGPVTFKHDAHVGYAGDCAKCHHQHPAGALKTCDGCHTIAPEVFKTSITTNSFKACKSCHSIADPDRPAFVSLKVAFHRQCLQCHKEVVTGDPKGCADKCHALKSELAGR